MNTPNTNQYRPTQAWFTSPYPAEFVVFSDVMDQMATEVTSEPTQAKAAGQIYGTCALISVLLVGLSFWAQLPRLTQASQEVQYSVSTEIMMQTIMDD